MSFDNQSAAQRLAMCNDIGEAAYVDSLIAAAMVDTLRSLPTGSAIMQRLNDRYGVNPEVSGSVSSVCPQPPLPSTFISSPSSEDVIPFILKCLTSVRVCIDF